MNKKYIYTYNKKCEICLKDFETQRYSTKICSDECVKNKLSQRKKYTDEQVKFAISLRLNGFIIPEIAKQTGIKKPSLQKIFQKNNIKLSQQDRKTATSRRWKEHEPIISGKKQCSKCKEFKNLTEFHNNNNNRLSGTVSSCKKCSRRFYIENKLNKINRNTIYRKNNAEKIKEKGQIYYEKNKDLYIEKASIWAKKNPEARKKIEKKYNDKNPGLKNSRTAFYRARKKQAQPEWLSLEQLNEIKNLYKNRPKGYCIDHIVPIAGENVCGLHVPWNLQYLPEYQNESKGNRFFDINQLVELDTCYQYKRKTETYLEDIENKMPIDSKIEDFDFNVEEFNNEHKHFIERYEWLGTVGYAPKWIFVARANNFLGGVIVVTEPNAYTKNKEGKLLEAQITRGATASWTPKNLGSKLLMFACNWMVNNTSKRLFFGYSDHTAGEIGTIYQACNFLYLGSFFGAKIRYKLENGNLVTSRYFRKTSTFKKYAKELNILWQKEWTKPNKYMDINLIPREILTLLKQKGKLEQQKCEQVVESPKGKYFLILGKDRRDKKKIEDLYYPIFGKSQPYPKRKTIL